jgi:hypothetical protein
MTTPTSTREISVGGAIVRAVGLTAAYVAGGFAMAIAAVAPAVLTHDLQTGLVARSLLVGVALVLVTLVSNRRRPLPLLCGIALAGYALNPFTWQGRAFVAQLWSEPGIATILLDGVAWVAVVALTGWLVRRAVAARGRAEVG